MFFISLSVLLTLSTISAPSALSTLSSLNSLRSTLYFLLSTLYSLLSTLYALLSTPKLRNGIPDSHRPLTNAKESGDKSPQARTSHQGKGEQTFNGDHTVHAVYGHPNINVATASFGKILACIQSM